MNLRPPLSFRRRFRQSVLLEKAHEVRTLLLVVIFARVRKVLLGLFLLRLLEEDSSPGEVIGGCSGGESHVIDQLSCLRLAIFGNISHQNLELNQLWFGINLLQIPLTRPESPVTSV